MQRLTAFELAKRFVGVREVVGAVANPQVMAMLKLDQSWPADDSVPWCSAFVNYIAWLLQLPRSKSLRARSWLSVGRSIDLNAALPEFDIVILSRGTGKQPGPSVIDAPGHVGFYVCHDDKKISILGGNQRDSVSTTKFPISRILGLRRLIG